MYPCCTGVLAALAQFTCPVCPLPACADFDVVPLQLLSKLGSSVDVSLALSLWPLAANMLLCHAAGLGIGWLQVSSGTTLPCALCYASLLKRECSHFQLLRFFVAVLLYCCCLAAGNQISTVNLQLLTLDFGLSTCCRCSLQESRQSCGPKP